MKRIVAWSLAVGLVALVIALPAAQHDAATNKALAEKRGPDARPSEWAFEQRTFPYGTWDRRAYGAAMDAARTLRAASKRGVVLGAWQFAGPSNIGGRVVDVAFDPVNPNVVYAAAATGGVFKSTDTGNTWQPIFDDQAVLAIGDVAVDPNDSQVLYVGTGEANGGQNNFLGGGMYKSTDGGQTWAFIGLEDTDSIARILVDPSNSQRVFAAAVGAYFEPDPARGVFRSDDGGATWEKSLFLSDSTGAIDLVMHPTDPSILYAAMWERVRRLQTSHFSGPTSGIYRTADGGETWVKLGEGLPDPETEAVGRIGLAISPTNPDILYALYNDGFEYVGLYKTTDGGATWHDADPGKRIFIGTGGFSWFLGQVRVHPEDPDVVFAMDVQLMRSPDGGADWQFFPDSPVLHADHHALAFHPQDPDYIVEGNDGGISISEDGGLSWRKVIGLPITQFYEIEIDPNFPERLYGGTQDNGTLRTLSGAPDDWERLRNAIFAGGDGFYVNVARENESNTIYTEAQFGVLQKSSDGGQRFSRIDILGGIPPFYQNNTSPANAEPRNWSTPFVLDPHDDAVLYVGTNRVYRSLTRGTVWRPISPPLTDWRRGDRLGTLTTIAVAPSNAGVVYAGTDKGDVWVTNDCTTATEPCTWTDISDGLPFRWVTRVVVDPYDENTAYATFSGLKWRDRQPHVFRTRDAGGAWEDITNNLPDAPVNAFAVDPNDPDVLYLGSDVGAFVSFDAGQTWEALGTGLPTVSVYDMKIDSQGRFLAAGTHGRSMYKIDLSTQPTAIEQGGLPGVAGFALAPTYPNPFRAETTIPYSLAQSGEVRLAVYDLLGREVRALAQGYQGAGDHTVRWDGRDQSGTPVASGTYLATLTMPGHREPGKTQTMVLVR